MFHSNPAPQSSGTPITDNDMIQHLIPMISPASFKRRVMAMSSLLGPGRRWVVVDQDDGGG